MILIFLDIDVILDFLGDRKPFSKHAITIFEMAYRKELQLFTSGNSVTTIHYILSKITGEKKSRSLITDLLKYVNIIPVTQRIIIQALNSSFQDFEDAVQYHAAMTEKDIKVIITRNLKDFSKSILPVNSPEEFIFNR